MVKVSPEVIVSKINEYRERHGMSLTRLYLDISDVARTRLHPHYVVIYHTVRAYLTTDRQSDHSTTYYALLVYYEKILREEEPSITLDK